MWKLQENILEKEDKEFLSDFIGRTDRFTQFEQVKLFEKRWSEWQGCKYSVFVNSGSSADLLMMDAVKELYHIFDDSEVIVPAVTWATNITSVAQVGLTPRFIDVNLYDFSFDYGKIEKAVNSRTKILLVTHLMGIPASMTKLQEIAKKYGLILLEDCCEAHGAECGGVKVGNFGLASTFSFYWGHHITTIEGGMICTDNEELYNLLLLKRSHGFARELPRDKHEEIKLAHSDIDFNFLFLTKGYNVRNTELHAVIGLSQLTKIDEYINIRNENYLGYLDAIEIIKDRLYIPSSVGVSSFCLPFIFRNPDDRKYYQQKFEMQGIETRPILGGNLLRHPCFKDYGYYMDYGNAEIVHQCGFYIGNNQFVNSNRINILKNILYDKS